MENFVFLHVQGKISREEVARICVAALESPYVCDKTFEVGLCVNISMCKSFYLLLNGCGDMLLSISTG